MIVMNFNNDDISYGQNSDRSIDPRNVLGRTGSSLINLDTLWSGLSYIKQFVLFKFSP